MMKCSGISGDDCTTLNILKKAHTEMYPFRWVNYIVCDLYFNTF